MIEMTLILNIMLIESGRTTKAAEGSRTPRRFANFVSRACVR